jgi:hypothetical protein
MLKLNKNIHLIILFVCTTGFIAFYLFHLIRNLKRVESDVKQLSTEVGKLTQDIQTVVNLVQTTTLAKCVVPTTASPSQTQQEDISPDLSPLDDESVNTDELKKILIQDDDDDEDDDDDDDDDDEVEEAENQEEEAENEEEEHDVQEDILNTITTTIENVPVPTSEELKKLKYDDIKDLCKKRGITIKGSKDQLIIKLLSNQ